MKNFLRNSIKLSAILFVVGLLFFSHSERAYAGSCTSTGATAWATASTWTVGCGTGGTAQVPVAADNVTVAHNVTIATGVAAVATNVTVNTGVTFTITSTGSLSMSGNLLVSGTGIISGTGALNLTGSGTTLDGSGSINLTGATTITNNKTINAAATLKFGGGTTGTLVISTGTTTNTAGSVLTISSTTVGSLTCTGTFSNSGTVSMTGSTTNATLTGAGTFTNAASTATLNYQGANPTVTTFTVTASGNTVNYSRAGTQTVRATTYSNLTLSGGSFAKTFTTSSTINGIWSIENGTTANTYTVTPTLGASATLQYNAGSSARTAVLAEWPATFSATGGVIIAGTGAITMGAAKVFSSGVPFTMQSGSKLTPSTFTLTFNGNYVNNGGSWTAAATPVIITGTATQSIGSFTTTGLVSMTKTAGTATLTGTVTANGGLRMNGSGGVLAVDTQTLNITGTVTNTAGSLTTAAGSTVNYTGVAQTVLPTTYNNLTLSGTGAKTFPTGTTTVNNVLSIENAANANTFTGSLAYGAAATLQYNAGASARTVSTEWPATFSGTGGVVIKGSGAISLNGAKVLSAGVTLNINTNAILTPGANLITLNGNFIKAGTLTSGSGGVTVTGTAAQSIDGFTTTGTVTMSKTGGTATVNQAISGNALTIDGVGGTLAFGSALNHVFTGAVTLTNGTLSAVTSNVTAASLSSSNSNVRVLTMGSGTWTLTGTGTVWNTATITNLTLNQDTSTVKINNNSASLKTFSGGGETYNNIWFAPATGAGTFEVIGSNTFADFKDDGTIAHSILFTAGTTQTVTTFTVSGNAGQLITINSGNGAGATSTSTHILSDTSGANNSDYLNIQHSVAQGGATWSAGYNSTNNNGVTTAGSGWIFQVATTTLGNGTDGGNSTVGPGGAATEIDRFSLATNTGTDTVTGMTVTLAGNANAYQNIATVDVQTTLGADQWNSRATNTWTDIASSSDGVKLVATTSGDYIYTSIDSGANWVARTNSGQRAWTSVASSSDGVKLVAVDSTASTGYIYTSTDSGANWTARTGPGGTNSWGKAVSSSDGAKLAVAGSSFIYTSTDSGANWTQQTNSGNRAWTGLASSSDGTKLVAGILGGTPSLWTSSDSGVNWTSQSNPGSRFWDDLSSSSDGTKLVAAIFSSNVMTSTDSGVNWTSQANAASGLYRDVFSSADGTRLVAVRGSGASSADVITSVDSGVNWTTETGAGTGEWGAVTGSSDGVTIAAAIQTSSPMMVRTPSGATTSKCSATPSSNTVTLTGCGISVTTTSTEYKILITPKTHANMPAVPGASYATTATVTSVTDTNSDTGTDSGSATITVDNASPSGVTSSTATGGNTVVNFAWTNPSDTDFTTGGTVVVLRDTATVSNVPVEGTTYTVGNTIGTATVACVITGSPPATTCQDSGLANGTPYYYEIFTQDSRGNYDAGTVPTGSPVTPAPGACTSQVTTGNWNTSGTWNCGHVPATSEAVVIRAGDVITMDVASNVLNTITINGSLTTSGTNYALSGTTLTIASTGTLTANGSTITLSGTSGTLFTKDPSGTFTAGSSTVVFSGNGSATINSGAITFNNLTSSGTGTKTLGGDATVGGALSISAGTFDPSTLNLTVTGTSSVTGTLNDSSATGTNLFTGAVTVNSGGTWGTNAANSAYTFRGGLTVNTASTFTSGTGVYTFDTNVQSIGGTQSFTITNLTNNVTTSTGLTFSGANPTVTTLTQGTNGILTFSGSMPTITTLTATASGNTVQYTSTSAQTIIGTTYHHVTIDDSSGSGTKTLGGNTILNGNLLVSRGTIQLSTFNITVNGTTNINSSVIAGNLNDNSATGTNIFVGAVTIGSGGTWAETNNPAFTFRGGLAYNSSSGFTSGTGIYTFDTNAQTISGTSAFTITNLTNNVSTSTGLTFSGANPTVTTLTQGTSAILTFSGTVPTITTLTATASPNTVQYTGASQSVKGTTYNVLTFSGSGTKTLGAATIINGNFTNGSSVTIATGNFALTLGGNFTNNGNPLNAGSSTITIAGTATQSIAGYTTTGLTTMTKTAGTATIQSALSGAGLTINGVGGTLNLGTALSHTFTGDVTLTAGTLNGGSSTLNLSNTSVTAWNGTGSNFAAGTGTVNFSGANQTLDATDTTFNILTFSGSGTKSISSNTVINGDLTNGSGVTINTNSNSLTFGGNFTNNGVALNAGGSSITIAGTATQSIAGYTTTGLTSMTKTSGTATFGSAVSGNGLSVNGVGGTLNLGTGLSHTFTGPTTLTNGTLNGGSSNISTSAFSSSNSNTRVLTMGSGTWTISGIDNTYATWNSADKSTSIALSNGNLTATGDGLGYGTARATIGKSSGKWYWEYTSSNSNNTYIGVANAVADLNETLGRDIAGNGWAFTQFSNKTNGGNFVSYGGDITNGMVVSILLDMDAGTITEWQNGVSQGTAYTGITGTIYPAVGVFGQANVATANFGATAFTYTPPGGYSGLLSGYVWDTSTSTGLTVTPGTSTIKLTNSSSSGKTFAGGGKTYNNLWYAPGSGTGSLTVTGSNTFNDFKDDGSVAHSILFTAGTTTHVSSWNVRGNSGQLITINSGNGTGGTSTSTHSLVMDGGGSTNTDYLNIQHSVATPVGRWLGGTNSTNNNSVTTAGSGWYFVSETVYRGGGGSAGGEVSSGAGSCTDGIQNGNETGVDTGGRCAALTGTCSDGIQNGNETGVDTGGRCGEGGGGSSTATGTAVISGGVVQSVTITFGGSGYTSPPIVSFCGGGGSGAAGTAVLTSQVVTSVTITNGGSAYSTAPTVYFGTSCPTGGPTSSGPLLPGTLANVAGGTATWSNPQNAGASDNVYATASMVSTDSNYLAATNFGFAIPTGATINGIVANVERKAGASSGSNGVLDETVQIIKSNGSMGVTNYGDTGTNWPVGDAVRSYGSSSDLWGETWTPADINNSNFGFGIIAYGGTPICFIAGTEVRTPEGVKNIEDLVIGDKVISFNESGVASVSNIVNTIKILKKHTLFTIETISGEKVTATDNQIFFTKKGLVEVSKIKNGDIVFMYKNGQVIEQKVKSAIKKTKKINVYDISLDDEHLFSANNFIVHNISAASVDSMNMTVYYTPSVGGGGGGDSG